MQGLYLLMGVIIVGYCVVNALVLAGLFQVAEPNISFKRAAHTLFAKTVLSVLIVYGFFALVAHMFCFTAFISQCLACICPALGPNDFYLQTTVAASILFFVFVTAVQAALIAIPRGMKPGMFISLVITSNVLASLIKMGLVSLLYITHVIS